MKQPRFMVLDGSDRHHVSSPHHKWQAYMDAARQSIAPSGAIVRCHCEMGSHVVAAFFNGAKIWEDVDDPA